MSPLKRKRITKLIVGGVVVVVAFAAWWSQTAKNDPNSIPAVVNTDVWPWARWLLLLGLVLGIVTVARRWLRDRLPGRSTTKAADARSSKATQGLAGLWEVWRVGGWWSLHTKATVLRPTLTASMSRWQRWAMPSLQLGVEVARVSRDGVMRFAVKVYAKVQGNSLFMGPTQSGKTQALSNIIVDHDGAILATSTNPNIVDQTMAARAWSWPKRSLLSRLLFWRRPSAMPREVWIFNPLQVGNVASTFKWNPIVGCHDPAVAIERAGYLLSGSASMKNVGSREFWESQAVGFLSRLMHAAGLGNQRTMLDVYNWSNDVDGSEREIVKLLAASPAAAEWIKAHTDFVKTNHNTRSSVTTSVKPALAWLQDPQLAATVMPTSDDEEFDVAEWQRRKATVYLLAEERAYSSIAPLFTVFTSYVFSEAKAISSKSLQRRLDPPVRLVLDEAPNICPVPLQKWTTDSAGRGIGIDIGIQSPAQLAEKWGERASDVIWDNLTTKVVFGGYDDPGTLNKLSAVCGTYREQDEDGRWHDRPVVPIDRIRRMEQWRVLLLVRGMRPAFGRVRPVMARRDIRALQARELRIAAAGEARRARVRLAKGEADG